MPGVGYITKSCVWSYNASLHSYVSIISQKSKEVTTNFILISSYQQNNIWHIKKEVKSTTDILTLSMHYKSREFSSPDTSEISMFLILHSVYSVQKFFSVKGKLACPWSFFVQFFYHAWPKHNIGPNQFDIWSNHNDIWTIQIVISDPISLISSSITQCYLLSFLTLSQWYLME